MLEEASQLSSQSSTQFCGDEKQKVIRTVEGESVGKWLDLSSDINKMTAIYQASVMSDFERFIT